MKPIESREELEKYLSGDRIQCLICGRFFKALCAHLSKAHGTNTRDYKDLFNIPAGHGLLAPETREKFAEYGKKSVHMMRSVLAEKPINYRARKKGKPPTSYDKKKRYDHLVCFQKPIKETSRSDLVAIIEALEMDTNLSISAASRVFGRSHSYVSTMIQETYPEFKDRWDKIRSSQQRKKVEP